MTVFIRLQAWEHLNYSNIVSGLEPGCTPNMLSGPALQAVPNLRHLDMQRCNYRPSLLGSLKDLCPQLESLRIGGFSKKEPAHAIRGSKQEKAAVSALLQCLPHIVDQAVQDSWEDDEQEEKVKMLYSQFVSVFEVQPVLSHVRPIPNSVRISGIWLQDHITWGWSTATVCCNVLHAWNYICMP